MTSDGSLIVLVHSPLVGPSSWLPVVPYLRALGRRVLVPELRDDGGRPYWLQHAASVEQALAREKEERRILFVGHSGAGPLLPAIARACGRPVGGYVFVDAGLPAPGSRLDSMEREDADFAKRLRVSLEAGGRFPAWTDDDLSAVLPDVDARRAVIASMRPRGLDFFSEPLPDIDGWSDAPCAYLQFSHAYDVPAAEAKARGWPVRSLDAGHFHMVVDPAGVARELVALAGHAGIDLDG